MNNRKVAIYESLVGGRKFLLDYPQVMEDIEDVKEEYDKLLANIILADNAFMQKERKPRVSARDVLDCKKKMSNTIFQYINKAIGKCEQKGNDTLLNKLQFNKKYIIGADIESASIRATEIKELIKSKMKFLTNILNKDITRMENCIIAYDAIKYVPTNTIKEKKNKGTLKLDSALKAGRKNISVILRYLLGEYAFTNPELIKIFKYVTVISIKGIRHTPTHILIVDEETDVAIKKASLHFTNKKGVQKVFMANDLGVVVFKSHKQGNVTYMSVAEGYLDTVVKFKVKRGHLNEFTVKMKKTNL